MPELHPDMVAAVASAATKRPITFSIEEDLLAKLNKSADLLKTPRSRLINAILRNYYQELKIERTPGEPQ